MDVVGAGCGGLEVDFRVVLAVFPGLLSMSTGYSAWLPTGGEARDETGSIADVFGSCLEAVTGVIVSRGSGDSRSPCTYNAAEAEGVS